VSGSGKSSFALDTVYAEGQRRYVESLSSYARQFLGQVAKPKVERVEGLSPAISIEQKTTSRSPRSTVGTVTEVFDYMRVLWARIGTPYCPRCDLPIGTQTCDEIVERILVLPEGTKALLLAPIEPAGNESYADLLARQKANGFARVRVDGTVHEIPDAPALDRRSRHTVEVVVDRIVIRANQRSRITDSVELALSLGNGWMTLAPVTSDDSREPASEPGSVNPVSTRRSRDSRRSDIRFSQRRSCTQCGTSYEELTPHHFSFNTRLGWCRTCEGLGVQQGASPDLIVPEPKNSIRGGAVAGWEKFDENPTLNRMMTAVADHLGFSLDTRWCDLPEEAQRGILYGTAGHWYEAKLGEPARPRAGASPKKTGAPSLRFQWKGFYPAIDEATKSSWQYRARLSHLTTEIPCQTCGGGRLREESSAARLSGKTMVEVCRMPLDAALAFFRGLKFDARQRKVAGELLVEIVNRLKFLVDVGLEYVTLNRSAPTLSGGESQRIRLASQIGSGLTGVLYVLDEPTIGLHPRDTRRLLGALAHLRDLGNTLLMVEHDREVIAAADHILDFGPGAGTEGGRIVAAASPGKLKRAAESLTGRYLAGKDVIPVPAERRTGNGNVLQVLGARHNNLKNVDASFALGRFIVVTGVSGSGKSSLVNDVLYNAMARRIHRANIEAGGHDELRGVEFVDKVIDVDQSPIGNSPSSNPATYTGVFDLIRELFARLPDAKVRGYNVNRFSFNRPGGRCEACEGNGQRCIEMHFLPDVWVTCETCGGARYKAETLEVKYKNKSIADVLEMRISEALTLFENQPKVRRMLQTLADVGLGYLSLGQPAPTLSGGEAQRVKLAAELGRPSTGKTLYILDEPTTGLHFDDLRKLLEVLHRFCDLGNTVICIEHNLDVIKTADWIIDLGPEGGIGGGEIIAEGTPEQIAANPRSHTGRIIAEILEQEPKVSRQTFDAAIEEEPSELTFDQDDLGEARMPWEIDGRGWHTRDRVAHRGETCQWEGPALEWIIDEIEKAGKAGGCRFSPTNYNSRSTVEIKMPGTQTPWFFHARTGNTWLLDATFRVPTRAFSAAEVRRLVPLKILDDCDNLPIYGRDPRVSVRHSGRLTDDIRILVNSKAEIATADCREFIQRAVKAYQRLVRKLAEDVAVRQPWRVAGKAWHIGQQMISKRDQILWRGALIAEVLGRIKKIDPGIKEDWTRKVMITLTRPGISGIWARLITNHPHAMRLEFRCRRGQFTPALVENLGMEVKIRQMRGPEDQVQFWLQTMNQCDAAQFDALIRGSITGLCGES
jgi:excinuclease ABC subunit A